MGRMGDGLGLLSLLFHSFGWISDKLFSPSRGIRQGDPLSSFLFVLAAKGLSKIIQAQEEVGKIIGLVLHEDMEK